MRRFVTVVPALLILIAAAAVFAAVPSALKQVQLAQIGMQVSLAQARLESGDLLDRISDERAAVHDANMPGVVHIVVTEGRGRDAEQWFRFGIGASGAGWFWDDRGHIITNAHLIENDGRIRVELFDGRVRRGRVLASDPQTDIAIIKIDDVSGLMPLRRASGDPVRVGDVCFVLGSPFGIKFSMSQGSVSGLNRSHGTNAFRLRTGYTNFIQTDAAMNPGNSGGPMVNANGEVIGMASAIANVAERNRGSDRDGGEFVGQSAGIGFAIPLETIENVVGQLLDRNLPDVIRGYLGLSLRDVDPIEARPRGFDGLGVEVLNVFEAEPAFQGGIRRGDIITAIDGRSTPTVATLQAIVSVQEPGVPIELTVWRDGSEMSLRFAVGAATKDADGKLNYIAESESMNREQIEQWIRRNRR